jgi:(2Fe-2S) ferredoxin
MVDRGVPPHDIAEFVGHTDGGRLVQELYGHLYPDNAISRAQAAWTRAA